MIDTHAGRVAIVTGASRGIGLAVAKHLVDRGANVLITARDERELTKAVDLLGTTAACFAAGSADDQSHQMSAIDKALERFGRIDYLVNNAGINPIYGPLLGMDRSASAKIFSVNTIAIVEWARLASDIWMGANGGAIVNVASIAALRPAKNVAMYAASKAAAVHLTEELAVELGPRIRVNAVAPALVRTSFTAGAYSGQEKQLGAAYPLGRLGSPEDVATAVGFLLSDDASWITGHTLAVDGGLLLRGGV